MHALIEIYPFSEGDECGSKSRKPFSGGRSGKNATEKAMNEKNKRDVARTEWMAKMRADPQYQDVLDIMKSNPFLLPGIMNRLAYDDTITFETAIEEMRQRGKDTKHRRTKGISRTSPSQVIRKRTFNTMHCVDSTVTDVEPALATPPSLEAEEQRPPISNVPLRDVSTNCMCTLSLFLFMFLCGGCYRKEFSFPFRSVHTQRILVLFRL